MIQIRKVICSKFTTAKYNSNRKYNEMKWYIDTICAHMDGSIHVWYTMMNENINVYKLRYIFQVMCLVSLPFVSLRFVFNQNWEFKCYSDNLFSDLVVGIQKKGYCHSFLGAIVPAYLRQLSQIPRQLSQLRVYLDQASDFSAGAIVTFRTSWRGPAKNGGYFVSGPEFLIIWKEKRERRRGNQFYCTSSTNPSWRPQLAKKVEK